MFCTNCGKKVKDGALFCTECGAKLEGIEATPVEMPAAAEAQENVVPTDAAALEQPAPEKKKKNMVPVIIVAAVVVVALIVGGIFFVSGGFGSGNDRDDEDERTEQQVDDETEESEDIEDIEDTETNSEEEIDFEGMSYFDILQEVECNGTRLEDEEQKEILRLMSHVFLDGYGVEDIYRTDLKELTDEEKGYLNYTILNTLAYHEEYGLEVQDVEIEGQEYATVFAREDVDAYLAAFYEGGSAVGIENGLIVYDDYVALNPADGGEWYSLGVTVCNEYGDYFWVRGNCYLMNNAGECEYVEEVAFLYKKSEDSALGYQLLHVITCYDPISVPEASVSSQLDDYNNKTYGAENLLDGDVTTAWVENAEGVGVGETIVFEFGTSTSISEILLYNGYLGSYRLYDINGKVTSISIDFGNGVVKEFELTPYDYYDTSDSQVDYCYVDLLVLDEIISTDKIIITITGAVEGSSYADTCISEIEFH